MTEPSDVVSRMPPGTGAVADAHQGWALRRHAPAAAQARPVDLLFLHGMAAGGWIWSPDWLGAFTGAGYRCWTLTLPGRSGGQTLATDPRALDHALGLALAGAGPREVLDALLRSLPGAALLDGPDLDDFAAALEAAVAQIGAPVVTVAHSLGGAVAQNALRRGRARPEGTVLLCSVPPYGTWRSALEMAVMNPELWRNLRNFSLFGLGQTDPVVLRRNLFPNGISDGEFAQMLQDIRDESLAATSHASGFPPFAPLPGPRRDLLVIGGTRDPFVPVLDVMMTAAYYGGAPVMVPGGGHLLMQEPQAGRAVSAILDWLARRSAVMGDAA